MTLGENRICLFLSLLLEYPAKRSLLPLPHLSLPFSFAEATPGPCLQLLTANLWKRFRKVIVTIMFCNHKILNPEICFLVTFS